ncbi:MAG: cysteine peptidase family C39 domain-containing protein [Runella sp.]
MESEDGNLIKAATTLLKLLEVNVTKETVTETVRVSPEYPSISSVSKSFSKWGIANVVAKLESHQFTTLLPPFITHLRQENKESFVVVTRINDEQIEYFSDVTYPIQNSLKSFLNEWTGVVLLAEANEYSGEKNYKRIKQNHQFRKIRKLGVFLGIFILVSLAMVSLKELWVIGIFALHLIGATACIILLIIENSVKL